MKCPKCNRQYATKRALDQHLKDSKHPPRASSQNNNRGRMRNNPRNPRQAQQGFDINPSRVPTPPGSTITVSGEDRLSAADISSGRAVFLNWPINTGMAPRLTTLSRAYQRISWLKVRVTVTPQASTTVNGGYVCGFSMDPTDNAITAAELSATQWSATKKWYETASVNMPSKRELLYTSSGEEPRLNVPAIFWLISEGKPSSSLTVIVTVNWTIRLSQPSLENGHFSGLMLVGEIWPVQNNYNLELRTEGKTTQDFSGIMPDFVKLQDGYSYFRVPTFNIEYSEGTGDTGTIQAHFIAYNKADSRMYYSQDGKTIFKEVWQSNVDAQVLLPCNTYLKYAGTGNPCGIQVLQPHPYPSKSSEGLHQPSTSTSVRLTQLEDSLKELMSFLKRDLMPLTENSRERPTSPASSTSLEMSQWLDPTKS